MEKSSRKFLLSITLFLSLLCFGMGLNLGLSPVAKAEGTLSIKSVQRTLIESYNSNPGGYRSEFIVKFDGSEDMLSAHKVGDNITATYDTFGTKVLMNGKNLSAIQDGYVLYKAGVNSVKIESGRPNGYAKFEFQQGLTIGSSVLAETITYYENQDWTYTTTAPEFRIQTIWARAYDNANYYQVTVSHTGSGSVSQNTFIGLKINGKDITEENSPLLSEFGKTAVKQWNNAGQIVSDYGNEGDPGASGTAFHYYITKSVVAEGQANGGTTITFPAGFTIGGKSLEKEQTFILPLDADHSSWQDMPIWVDTALDTNNEGFIKLIKQTDAHGVSHYATYEIEINNATDVFADFAVGDDLTYFLKSTNLYKKLQANGANLISCDSNKAITFKKLDVNKVEMKIAACVNYLALKEVYGIKLPGVPYYLNTQETFYENQDWTFTQSATEPDFKVFAVYPIGTGSFGTGVGFRIVFNGKPGSNGTNTNLDLTGVTLNGVQLKNGSGLVISPSGETVFGGTQYGVTINGIHGSDLPTVITFPKGWSVNSKGTLSEKQEFACIDDNDYNYGKPPLPKFTELLPQTVTYKQGETIIGTVTDTSVELPDPTTLENYNDGKSFIGWTDGTNLYKAGDKVVLTDAITYSVVELDAKTVGAELKIWGATSGIRFVTQINLAEWSAINPEFLGEYGTLVARADDLGENALTIEAANADSKVKKIVTSDVVIDEGIIEIRGGVENIPSLNYTKTIRSCAYLTINYTTGVGYVYTDVIERSMASVAQELLDSNYEFVESQIAWLNTYAGIEG